uniref:hypothetical protein n=1 Tax=Dysosmobacter welbionis TaxID=2093857 RepID=UPI003FEE2D9D
ALAFKNAKKAKRALEVRSYTYENGIRVPIPQTVKKNSNLKPDIKSSFEWGLEMKFLENRG